MIGTAATLPLELALRDVLDPETGLNVVDLGLIYGLAFNPETGAAHVTMTLTSPYCPAGEQITFGVQQRLEQLREVSSAEVEVTFEPRWTPLRVSDEGRAQLGWG